MEPVTSTTLDVAELTYSTALRVCAMDPAAVFEQAGTTDLVAAAEWFGLGTTAKHRDRAVAGCLEGLTGR